MADRKLLNKPEKEGLQQQLSSKRCKVLDGKDQKRAETSIETTGIRKAMKERLAKARKTCDIINTSLESGIVLHEWKMYWYRK
jgi:hypothetical protein